MPAPGGSTNFNHVQGADTLGSMKSSFGLIINYANAPLVMGDDTTTVDVINPHTQADITAAIGLGSRFQIGLAIPYTLNQATAVEGLEISQRTLGDIRLVPKLKLTGSEKFGLALALPLSFGTGSDFQTSGGLTYEPKLLAEVKPSEKFRLGVNLGYLGRTTTSVYETLTVGNELTYGLGADLALKPGKLDLIAEAFGRTGLTSEGVEAIDTLPLEANVGLRISSGNHAFTVGGGPGITEGYGTPSFRLFLGYAFTARGEVDDDKDKDGIRGKADACPDVAEDADRFEDENGCPDPDNDKDGLMDNEDRCPNDPEDKDGFEDADGCPDNDNDKDGILDKDDKCPNKAETKNGYEDADGCPESDKDEDGIADAIDKCPEVAEDADKWQDEDGCPDPDNDGDKLLDKDDKCPNEAEDFDKLGDEDGCPEKDFDKDGIEDTADKCPAKPETINNNKDEDGCPDEGATKVQMTETKIEILEKVYFDTDKDTLQRRSESILNQVAAILKANPQVTKVEIGGHTDDVGNDDYNLDLSQRRVDTVKKYLIGRGVAAERLDSKGYGETKPLVENNSDANRAKNRRVEFVITEVDGKAVAPSTTTPPVQK